MSGGGESGSPRSGNAPTVSMSTGADTQPCRRGRDTSHALLSLLGGSATVEALVMLQHHSLLGDFNRLRRMKDAQARGYRLQEFVGTLFTKRHFDVRLNSRAARPRQTDLVARKGNDVFVIESKWQGTSTDIDDLTSLRDRLERTAGLAIGIF